MKKYIFEDLNVVEITSGMVGPWATTYFANNGAKVVMLESMTALSLMRTTMPFRDNIPGINRTAFGALVSPNRYGMSLNLRHPQSVEVKNKLIKWADVIIENYAPGVMEKWGLGYDELQKINPGIIMARGSSQGQDGPHGKHPAYGFQLSSLSGFSYITGWPDGLPQALAGAYTDTIGPRFFAAAIIAALDYKRRTGKGQLIDLSEHEASLQFLIPSLLDYSLNNKVTGRVGNSSSDACPHQVYKCQGEDRWCAIAVFNDKEWKNFCNIIGNPPWAARFPTFESRKNNENELDRLIEIWTINYSAEEIMERMQKGGVAAGVVKNPRDLCEDPQLQSRNTIWLLDHPEMGPIPHYGQFFEMSKCSVREEPTAYPCLGVDTEYVCTKLLGMTEEEFDTLLINDVFE